MILASQDMFLEMATSSAFSSLQNVKGFMKVSNDYAWNNPNVQRFIHSTGQQHFDLVINEDFFAESFLIFAHIYKAPVVSICEFKFDSF